MNGNIKVDTIQFSIHKLNHSRWVYEVFFWSFLAVVNWILAQVLCCSI